MPNKSRVSRWLGIADARMAFGRGSLWERGSVENEIRYRIEPVMTMIARLCKQGKYQIFFLSSGYVLGTHVTNTMARVRLVRSTSRGPSFESGKDRTGFSSPCDHPSPRSTWSWSCSDAWTCLRLTMKVWAITLDVSTLNSTAFETVREHWHVYLLPFGLCLL